MIRVVGIFGSIITIRLVWRDLYIISQSFISNQYFGFGNFAFG